MSTTESTSLPELWQSYLRRLEPGQLLDFTTLPHSTELNVAACRYLFMQLAQAYTTIFHADPDRPQFLPHINQTFNIGGPNPDAVYYWTRIRGGGLYRICGRRNNVHFVDLQTGYRYWGWPDSPGKTFPSVSLDDFYIGEDGRFELLLGTSRPDGHQGNWLQVDPQVDYILVRQFAYDWSEQDASLAIECLDTPVPPGPALDDTCDRLELLVEYFNKMLHAYPRLRQIGAAGKVNDFAIVEAGVGGLTRQVYLQGTWNLAPDEALLCEVRVPDTCFYWNVQTADMFWSTVDMTYRQSSVNGHQVVTDEDGITRLVFSAEDPGLPNWLDTGGLPRGDILWRWLKCSSTPVVSSQVLKLGELGGKLPATVKRISADQRREQLRQRSVDAQLRRRW